MNCSYGVMKGSIPIIEIFFRQGHPTDCFGKLFVQNRRPLIPSDFLKRIFTSNFHVMRNLMSVVFGLLRILFWVPIEGQLSFLERR